MSGKEAAPALSVEIDEGAITMEEDRSWLYAANRSSAAAGAGTPVLAQSLPAAPKACLPARQNAGTAVVSLVATGTWMPVECSSGFRTRIGIATGFRKKFQEN